MLLGSTVVHRAVNRQIVEAVADNFFIEFNVINLSFPYKYTRIYS